PTTHPRRPRHHDKPRHRRLVESHHQRTNRLGTTPTHRLPHPLCPLELHQHQSGLHLPSPTKHHPALPTQQRQQHPATTLPRRPRHHDKPRHQRLVESHHQRTNRLGTTPTHRLPHPLPQLDGRKGSHISG